MQQLNLKEVPDKFIYEEYFRRVRCYHYPERRIVLFGPPGSGKGTQAARLTNEICSCHISTGEMLRNEMRQGSDIGLKAKEIMNKGDLVPDEIVINMIEKKIKSKECAKGVVFDGFPRTVEQAKKLDDMLEANHKKIDKVFSFELDEKTLIERISGRRVHEKTGRAYHVKYNPPKVEGKDDFTGENLIQREDDNEFTMSRRFQTYRVITAPLLQYYKEKGVLLNVDAKKHIDNVWQEIAANVFMF